jgi:hypothetical protein
MPNVRERLHLRFTGDGAGHQRVDRHHHLRERVHRQKHLLGCRRDCNPVGAAVDLGEQDCRLRLVLLKLDALLQIENVAKS